MKALILITLLALTSCSGDSKQECVRKAMYILVNENGKITLNRTDVTAEQALTICKNNY